MSKFGMFQILGAAVTTVGLMFLIITCLSYTGILPIEKISIETAFMSLLMATNGFMILLFGVITVRNDNKKSVPATTVAS